MPKESIDYLSLRSDILESVCLELRGVKGIPYLSLIRITDMYTLAEISNLSDLQCVIDIFLKDLQTLKGIKFVERISADAVLMIHELQDKNWFTNALSETCMSVRKNYANIDSSLSFTYKCGTSEIKNNNIDMSDAEIKYAINSAYMKAFSAASRALIYNSSNHVFSDSSDLTLKKFINQKQLLSQLQDAICENRFKIAFQPIVNCRTNNISWYESLFRLVTREGVLMPPGLYICAAEKMGFIHIIDEIVLKLAISELEIDKSLMLAINVSSASLDNPDWVHSVHQIMKNSDAVSRLIVEITETISPIGDIRDIGYCIRMMRDMGVQIALDDFGSGNTSLQQMRSFKPDIIKIDGSLINPLHRGDEDKFLLDIAIEYAKAFNAKTIAEFVETAAIAEFVCDLGVDYMQGNYLGEARLERRK